MPSLLTVQKKFFSASVQHCTHAVFHKHFEWWLSSLSISIVRLIVAVPDWLEWHQWHKSITCDFLSDETTVTPTTLISWGCLATTTESPNYSYLFHFMPPLLNCFSMHCIFWDDCNHLLHLQLFSCFNLDLDWDLLSHHSIVEQLRSLYIASSLPITAAPV